MSDSYHKFIALLESMFRFDSQELDFGIYRIMNAKREEIRDFLHNRLLPQVKASLAAYRSADLDDVRKELERLKRTLEDAGMDPEQSPKYKELRAKLEASFDAATIEHEVYADLTGFFRRYYDRGDFLSKRRYKKDVYAIPYEGEEVKLHYANADQYYIKTSEYFRDYAFALPSGRKVHFTLVDASTEQNNVKEQEDKERKFVLYADEPLVERDGELYVQFEYKIEAAKQSKLNEQAVAAVLGAEGRADWLRELATPMPTDKNKQRTLLEKQLTDYTAKNTFDYFIHKDLGGFLRRELDFYIKNELMHLDDLDTDNEARIGQYLSKIKAVKQIAHKIIRFLEQIENFQKKLWLKKKFVVDTNYCVTLDLVPRSLYAEIAANDAQREEWKRLYAIEALDGYAEPLTEPFLEANPSLVLDTVHFSRAFVDKLLAGLDDIDGLQNGLLIHSENFQALNTIRSRYEGRIDCIYIDPPYNTNATEILYKNGFKHSSWLSLIDDRVSLAKPFLREKGILCVTIDDYELPRLWPLLGERYGYDNHLGTAVIRINPGGRKSKRKLAAQHEYALFFATDEHTEVAKLPVAPEDKTHSYKQAEDGSWYEERNLRKEGQDSLAEEGAARYYPIYYDPATGQISATTELPEVIWPIDTTGQARIWRRGKEDIDAMFRKGDIFTKETKYGRQVYFRFRGGVEGETPKTLWVDPLFSASEHGTQVLDDLVGKARFDFPKSPHAVAECIRVMSDSPDCVVLDFFGGSGTTGHAVVDMNRSEPGGGGKRKYILVEMGNHFYTALKPRVCKAVYASEWKDGKPVKRDGVSQLIKVLRLESYEDSLNNIEPVRTGQQELALAEMSGEAREAYTLSYMLETEAAGSPSLLNVRAFDNPFDYKLRIATGGETKTCAVDLVETFNYLLGLTVRKVEASGGFKTVRGELPTGETALVVWRNVRETTDEELERLVHGYTQTAAFDAIYVNGDNHLENAKTEGDTWKVQLIEEQFHRLMFDAAVL
ncbi:site-specific DNA-methyltransferase [Paenibacillus sp. GYB003]|uniref:site-specific DNA-methyltransferase n=1 Tax=Paenibacillus sp. GYB003 TaxID=2994392 RepID=UPI002F960EB4